MQSAMLRLDALLRRRRWVVLGAWAVLLIAALPLAARQSENLTGGGFTVPGSESERVLRAVETEFPTGSARTSLAAVVVPRPGASAQQLRQALQDVDAAAKDVADVELPTAARRAALRQLQAGLRRPVVVPLDVTVDDMAAADVAADLRAKLGLGEQDASAPVALHLVGQSALWAGLQDLSKSDLESAEATGLPIVLLILLAVFGSLAAAALPLVLGAVSVLLTGALIHLLSQALEMSVFVTNMSSMIGIGVAVDYSLFVLARYREEVQAGRPPEEARAVAGATSGVAVLFSGATVIVSLAGLYLVPTTAIRSMALGAILVVAVSMLASATLLPVLIRLLGRRAYAQGRLFTVLGLVARSWRGRRRGSTRPEGPPPPSFWTRWTATVTRRPVLAVAGATAVLLALAVPTLSLQTGDGALRQFPAGYETRVGFEAAAQVTSPGASSPLRVVAPAAEATAVTRALRADREVARVLPPVPSRDGAEVLVTAVPRRDGEAAGTKELVRRLRDLMPAGAQVGGNPAQQVDFTDTVSGSMWKIVLFVLGLSYLVLMLLLRSVVLPLKAVLMNLLSVGAAYGVMVAVFQWGWADGFLGFESPGYIDTITPPLVLAVVFGLSMDYEVFLLTRIRERYAASGDTKLAVAEGLARSARTITSAALIMVAVFAVFVGTGVPSIKQLGLGNAVAIAVDATLVRLVLVPAAMELLGRWNWYLPAWLGRRLPEVAMEELAPERLGRAATPAEPEAAKQDERELVAV